MLRADVDQGFFSSLWLCGGGDAVDDKAIEKVRKHNDRSGDIRTARVNDAARVTESADLFVREFKQTMRERGFAGFKYNRNGRSAPRIFLLDTNEQMVQWKTKKTAKVVNGDKFDALLLVDIEDVSRGCEARASRLLQGDEAKRVLTIHCAARRLVVGFETEQRCQMFADGLALIVAEAKERLKPKASRAAPAPASADDLDAASRVVRA